FAEGDVVVLSALDTSSQTDRQLAAVRPEEKLRAVLEIARALGGTIDLDDVLRHVLESLFGIFPRAERGLILLRDGGREALVLRAAGDRRSPPPPPLVSRTIFRHVVVEGQAVLCEDVAAEPRFAQAPSVQEAGICTMLCVPLRESAGKPFGVLQIDT